MRRGRAVALALAPPALGLLVAALLGVGPLPDPVLRLQIDLGTLAAGGGLGGGALVAALLAARAWAARGAATATARAAEAAAADRRRFLRRLDHELKNPLTAIRVGLANLGAGGAGPGAPERGPTLDSVAAQATRLGRLAADLRKLAELETRAIERAPLDPSALLREVVALAGEGPAAGGRHLALVLPRAPWPLPALVGDRDLLGLALHNLVDNALKFSRPGDTIEVRAFEDGAAIVVEVADTGPGIPAAEVGQVWEELYRGEAARAIPGSGLGLALVRAIAVRHRGEARVRSRPDRGTVVTLRLPLA